VTRDDLASLHREALERFRVTAAVEQKQRARELEDLKFADPIEPEDQWPADALRSRAGLPAQGNLPPVPPRPALTINKLRQPLQQLQNAQRQARLALEFAPDGDGADDATAEAFEDIARAIQRDSRAHLARNWAFDRALRCGRGFYRVETDYTNDHSFDQQIVYQRILNQFTVYFYPFCTEPDYSDAEWCFLTADLPWPVYRRQYGDSALADFNDEELSTLGNELTGWVSENDEGKCIRIAEYYWFQHETDTLVQMTDGTIGLKSDLKIPADDPRVQRSRDVDVRRLRWAKLNGVEFLQDPGFDSVIVERDGRYIPVIPVIADESNINGERRYTGLVRPAIPAQRLFNVEVSSLAEAVHLGPIAPFIGYATQFEGYEAWWAQLNTRRFPYLPVNPPQNPNEAALPIPQRNTAEQPIQAIVVSLNQADGYINATTNVNVAALGHYDPKETSGKAVMARQQQSDLATSGYLDNLAQMSLLLEGKILRDLIPRIYDRPGRVVPAQGEDDERRNVMLKQPFTVGPQGQPQMAQASQKGAQSIDLAKGQYSVAATVGKSYTTRREEGAASMGDLMHAVPQIAPAFMDLYVKNLDFPGARQIADRLAKGVPPQFRDDPNGQPDPQQLQQQLQQAHQMLDVLTKELKGKTQIIETDQIKADNQLKVKQFEAWADLQKLEKELAAKIEIARITAAKQAADLTREAMEESIALQHSQAHEAALQLSAQDHQQQLSAQQHQQSLEQGAQQGQQAMDQQAQQAALQPEPSGANA
jgi:Phage P22-like portal protein